MNIRVHISELVLHGFAPSDRYRIAEAVESSLSRLFMERGVPPGLAKGGRAGQVNAGAFQMDAPARPDATGAHIARALYGGLRTWASE